MTPEPTMSLTEDQIAFYHENGYLVLEAITTADEIATMRQAYDRIFTEDAGRDEGNAFDLAGANKKGQAATLPQILNPEKYAPELLNTLYRANAAVIAKQLLGDSATVGKGGHAIRKPPSIGAATPLHQDEAYWNEALEYNSLSIWLPLQDATVENGCMQFVPKSHLLGVVPHRSIGKGAAGLIVDESVTDIGELVPCPIPAGGAMVHHSRTFHYAGPNTTSQVRRAYIIGASTKAKERETPRDFYWQEEMRRNREAAKS